LKTFRKKFDSDRESAAIADLITGLATPGLETDSVFDNIRELSTEPDEITFAVEQAEQQIASGYAGRKSEFYTTLEQVGEIETVEQADVVISAAKKFYKLG
jgi:hypothetical protein